MEKKESRFLVLAKRMSRNTNAMIGLAIFVVLVLSIIIVPLVSPYDYSKMDVTRRPPPPIGSARTTWAGIFSPVFFTAAGIL